MSLALYMGEHIDSVITGELVARGINVQTVQSDGHSGFADPVLLRRAYELRRVLVTKDADFFQAAATINEEGGDHYGIVYVRDRLASLGDLIADLELFAQCCEPDEVLNTITKIPLRN